MALAELICGGGAALVGFVDDRSPVSPAARLVALLALTLGALVIDPELLPAAFNWGHLPPTPVVPWLCAALVALGMAGFVNAVNMADGQDGCVAGMFVIWAGCILLAGAGATTGLVTILLATSLAVLAFNLRGKVFLGGAGAYGVTFVFGLVILELHNRGIVTAETIIVWFFVPVVDCLRLMIARPLQGRSPFDADRNHLHHRLHRRFGDNTGLAIYLGVVAVSSVIAVRMPDYAPECLAALACIYAGLIGLTRAKSARIAPRTP
jgi:UDP-GlcNAc:undecaprenyl-phosphate GlcNAc-1-phosphate transferase